MVRGKQTCRKCYLAFAHPYYEPPAAPGTIVQCGFIPEVELEAMDHECSPECSCWVKIEETKDENETAFVLPIHRFRRRSHPH
jgi:hypothetical protein